MATRLENLDFLIRLLCEEQKKSVKTPNTLEEKKRLLRALMNTRPPIPASQEFLTAQDAELTLQSKEKGIVSFDQEGLLLWQGDITRLKVDAIVNAANSQMLGCFVPLHACIDNAIHSAAGVQLRWECQQLMRAQGHEEATGSAKITAGYNLPAKHVIHTVGPIIYTDSPSVEQQEELASCYNACMCIAEEYRLTSIAFCCISTGVFHFPPILAAAIALKTVRAYQRKSLKTIVFNVFTEADYLIYERLLRAN